MAYKTKKQQNEIDFSSIMDEIVAEKFDEVYTGGKGGLVDIHTFCIDYLGVKFDKCPYLKLILKMFYMNTPGNEHLEITDEDIDLIKRIRNYRDNPDFYHDDCDSEFPNGNPWLLEKAEKLRSGQIKKPFQYLVLVLGRRSGKTFCSSIILTYEVYKLLQMVVCPKCEDIRRVDSGEACPECGTVCERRPQAYYGLNGNEPLRILLAATTLHQAKDPGLEFIKLRVGNSPFFDGKYIREAEHLWFKTEYDILQNERNKKYGLAEEKGSVFVRAISSNSSAVHGTGSIAVLLDEFALFNSSESSESKETDKALLEALLPQTLVYQEKHGDGRIIMISMPDKKEGQFYKYYERSKRDDDMLMMQMPTWEFNQQYTKEGCEKLWKANDDGDGEGSFDKLFGAQFLNEGVDVFIDELTVDKAFYADDTYRERKPSGNNPHYRHFMHVDCAFNSDNYAYLILHTEYRMNPLTGKYELYFVEDDSGFWTPSKRYPGKFESMIPGEEGKPYDVYGILDYIVRRAKSYRVNTISYDNMQSSESKVRFAKAGLQLRQIPFSGMKKFEIYGILKEAMITERVILCSDDTQLQGELKALRVRYTKNRGKQIVKSTTGIYQSDDVADCLAGACYSALERGQSRLAKPKLGMTGNPGTLGRPGLGPGASIYQRAEYLRGYTGGFS